MPITQEINLTKYLDAQNQTYLSALAEIRSGKKVTHWMWFIFPQIKGLGRSSTAHYYAIENLEEAAAYLSHPILGKHLVEISEALLISENSDANAIFGSPDDLKLRSSMTLFAQVPNADVVFEKVLHQFFNGNADTATLKILKNQYV